MSTATCDRCAEYFASEPQALSEFLETLPAPVLVVDDSVKILGANSSAIAYLGKSRGDIESHRAGDVIECVNAREPGGCGSTVHCQGCAIRQTVTETYQSGNPREGVVAYQDVLRAEGIRRVWFRISTERAGEVVLLRIDEVGPERQS